MAFRLGRGLAAANCPSRHLRLTRRPLVLVACDYSFASSVPERQRGARPDRAYQKRQEGQLKDVVQGLTNMNEKQLTAVAHLLNSPILEAVGVASKIKGQNQGRKRQEMFVAKLIREYVKDEALYRLKDAMYEADRSSGTFQDPDIVSLIEVWKEGLMANDKAVSEEAIQALLDCGSDIEPQKLRAIARQAQKGALENEKFIEEQTAAAAAAEEDETAPRPGPIGPKPNKPLRDLHKILKPAAEYRVKHLD